MITSASTEITANHSQAVEPVKSQSVNTRKNKAQSAAKNIIIFEGAQQCKILVSSFESVHLCNLLFFLILHNIKAIREKLRKNCFFLALHQNLQENYENYKKSTRVGGTARKLLSAEVCRRHRLGFS